MLPSIEVMGLTASRANCDGILGNAGQVWVNGWCKSSAFGNTDYGVVAASNRALNALCFGSCCNA